MPAMPATRSTRGEARRREILQAAEKRFAEFGFIETRLEDIGADLGLAASAILYHFGDKRGLYRAVLSELFSGLHVELQRAMAGPSALPERIDVMVGVLVDYAARRPAAAHLALREAVTNDPELRADMRAQAAPFLRLLTVMFAEGERMGVIEPGRSDPFHFMSAISGIVIMYIAALPTFVEKLPYELLDGEQVEALRRDVVDVARRLLRLEGQAAVMRVMADESGDY